MKHARSDYDCIQPWPTKRPHIAKDPVTGNKQPWNALHDGSGLAPIIPDDEPVFLIRAQDIVGPHVVEYWADQAEVNGADPDIVQTVRNHASLMRVWQEEHGHKVPDAPVGTLR